MSRSSTTATTIIGPPCTNYLQVTITVPSGGTVLVQAQVWVAIDHTFGTRDLANLRIADAPGSCGLSPYTSPVDVPADAPTATSFSGVFLQTPFPVTAGTYTFYFNGFMGVGQNALDNFYYGNMVAVFYPS
jgi:hypothetical protein